MIAHVVELTHSSFHFSILNMSNPEASSSIPDREQGRCARAIGRLLWRLSFWREPEPSEGVPTVAYDKGFLLPPDGIITDPAGTEVECAEPKGPVSGVQSIFEVPTVDGMFLGGVIDERHAFPVLVGPTPSQEQ